MASAQGPAPEVAHDNDSANESYLQSMFPDLDPSAIHDCYVLCERNVERTVEFLLGTESDAPPRANIPPGSTHDLDEELARQLEQEEIAAAAAASRAPVEQRTLPSSTVTPGNPPAEEPSIQEQVMKIAETGKKTFNTIFAKVRDKLKEFDDYSATNTTQPYPPAPVTTPYASTSRPVIGPPMQGTQIVSPAPVLDHATQRQQVPAAAGASAQAGTSAPVIEASKPAFFDRKPTQLVETQRSHPEEDLTENPFDDQNH